LGDNRKINREQMKIIREQEKALKDKDKAGQTHLNLTNFKY
jgi:hypothetical protein